LLSATSFDLALSTVGEICCDRPHEIHKDPQQTKRGQAKDCFPGKFVFIDPATGDGFYGDRNDPARTPVATTAEKRKAEAKYRKVCDRPALVSRLIAWRRLTTMRLGPFYPPSFILNDSNITKLSLIHPDNLSHHDQLVYHLGETPDWGATWAKTLFTLIQDYDNDLNAIRPALSKKDHEPPAKRTKVRSAGTSWMKFFLARELTDVV
jgi:hypothetical protein